MGSPSGSVQSFVIQSRAGPGRGHRHGGRSGLLGTRGFGTPIQPYQVRTYASASHHYHFSEGVRDEAGEAELVCELVS